MAKDWAKDLNKGALHRALKVPGGEKIPAKKMAKAMRSKNAHVRKMANAAKGLKTMRKHSSEHGFRKYVERTSA